MLQSRSFTPAAIAGMTRDVLWMRTKSLDVAGRDVLGDRAALDRRLGAASADGGAIVLLDLGFGGSVVPFSSGQFTGIWAQLNRRAQTLPWWVIPLAAVILVSLAALAAGARTEITVALFGLIGTAL